MRGSDERTGSLLATWISRRGVRKDHPLRTIRTVVSGALFAGGAALNRAGEAAAGEPLGTPADGAAGVRSVVPLVRRVGIDDVVWDHSTFSKHRDRLLEGDIAAKFLAAVLARPRVKALLSREHFSTARGSWASMKSFKPKDGGSNAEADFHGHAGDG